MTQLSVFWESEMTDERIFNTALARQKTPDFDNDFANIIFTFNSV